RHKSACLSCGRQEEAPARAGKSRPPRQARYNARTANTRAWSQYGPHLQSLPRSANLRFESLPVDSPSSPFNFQSLVLGTRNCQPARKVSRRARARKALSTLACKIFVKLLALLLATVVGFRPGRVVGPGAWFYFAAERKKIFSPSRLLVMLSAAS